MRGSAGADVPDVSYGPIYPTTVAVGLLEVGPRKRNAPGLCPISSLYPRSPSREIGLLHLPHPLPRIQPTEPAAALHVDPQRR
jgi:hypothetical protein